MKIIFAATTAIVFGLGGILGVVVDASRPAPQAATMFERAVDDVLWATGHASPTRPPGNWWEIEEEVRPLPGMEENLLSAK